MAEVGLQPGDRPLTASGRPDQAGGGLRAGAGWLEGARPRPRSSRPPPSAGGWLGSSDPGSSRRRWRPGPPSPARASPRRPAVPLSTGRRSPPTRCWRAPRQALPDRGNPSAGGVSSGSGAAVKRVGSVFQADRSNRPPGTSSTKKLFAHRRRCCCACVADAGLSSGGPGGGVSS